jgi:LysM repeat protein
VKKETKKVAGIPKTGIIPPLMSLERPTKTQTKLCPTCGTRVSEDAVRCLVCGTDLSGGKNPAPRQERVVQGSRMPEYTFSLPIVLVIVFLFLSVGGGLTYAALNGIGVITTRAPETTETPTPSITPSPSPVTPTATSSPQPTATPLNYIVKEGDLCATIAFAFNISINSIILENNLDVNCSLSIGQELRIPQPTPTPTPLATSTLTDFESTREACEVTEVTVQETDTLSTISATTGVPVEAIMEWNGLTTDTAFLDQVLFIPLCFRDFDPFSGATVTPSPAPPYPAPQLLLPADGQAFTLSQNTVSLQWSSVGTLRPGEAYQVTVIDVTSGDEVMLVAQVTDTTFIVPASMRPATGSPHVFRWYVEPVAQVGVDSEGQAIWVSGGALSMSRTFTWSGAAAQSTPTP